MSDSLLLRIVIVAGLPLVIILLAVIASYFRIGAPLDNIIYDNSQRIIQEQPYKDLLIIEIDEKSLLELGRWPWPRKTHAQLLNILTQSNINAVGFDIIFSDNDLVNPESDQAFIEALKANGKAVLPMHIEQLNHTGQMFEVLPTPDFFQAAASVGHVHVEYDGGVSRSVYLKEGLGEAYWPHFTVELLQLETSESIVLSGNTHTNTSPQSPLNIIRDYHNLIPFHFPANSFKSISYVDVINGVFPASLLEGKTVLVGATATGLSDVINTPIGVIPGVELNGYILHALRTDTFINALPMPAIIFISGLTALLAVLVITGMAVQSIFFIIVVSNIIVVLGSVSSLLFVRVWFPPMATIIAISCFYPLFSWQRLSRAISYLRRELEVLLAEDSANDSARSLGEILIGLEYLELVLPVKHWQIFEYKNENKIRIKIMGDGESISRSSDLKEEMLVASKLFSIDDKSYVLEVFWKDIYAKVFTPFLDQLLDPSPSKAMPHTWGDGIVERTIDELNLAKEKVDKNSRLVHQTLSQLSESVVVADFCGRVIFINNEAKQILMQSEKNEHLISLLAPIKINNGISWVDIIKEMLDKHSSFSFEARMEETDMDFICQGDFLSIEGKDPDSVILTMTNTSQLKKVERERRDALSFLSHDLQAPMVSVISIIERERLATLDKKQSDLLGSIDFHIRKNLGYAEKFLQLSRAENFNQTKFSLCDMYDVMDAAIYQTIHAAKVKNITVESERCQEETWVHGNSDLLERAVTNLLSNAVKYSKKDTQVTTKVQVAEGYVYIIIVDQGEGIKEDEIDGLFNQFQRGKEQDQKGTGLGLSFVKVVAKKHNGNVQLRSKYGVGTTAIFSLPLVDEDLTV